MNKLTLKWGTVKGWEIKTPVAQDAFKKWSDGGVSMSAMTQHDTTEQKEALLELIDLMDEIYLDWDGKYVSRDEAKEYLTNYGKK